MKPIVIDVLFDGDPIDLTRVFTVCITDALGKGKYGYKWMKSAERIIDEESSTQIQDIIKLFCESKNDTIKDVSLGRIKQVME
jgi:hypothetical protein